MSLDPEEGRLRPVKIHGVVLDEDGSGLAEPVAGPPAVRLVRELKRAGAAGRTLTGQPVEPELGRLMPGPGAGAAPAAGRAPEPGEPTAGGTGVVRFLLRLLGRDTGID